MFSLYINNLLMQITLNFKLIKISFIILYLRYSDVMLHSFLTLQSHLKTDIKSKSAKTVDNKIYLCKLSKMFHRSYIMFSIQRDVDPDKLSHLDK